MAAVVLAICVRIAIDADSVAELAAKKLICRNAPGLSRKVPERDLYA